MGIEQELEQLWADEYGENWNKNSKLTTRTFPCCDSDEHPIKIIHNTIRDNWESVKRKEAEKRDRKYSDACPLDTENATYIPYQDLLFKFNENPTLKYHLFVKAAEHRERPRFQDHHTILDFVDETDYAVYLNLRGSGAGIPDHLHYQGHKRMHFPLLFKHSLSEIKQNPHVDLLRTDMIHYGLLFKYRNEKGKDEISRILVYLDTVVKEIDMSYNLLFDKGCVFLFPRTREVASNLPESLVKAGMDRWQIAGQEMGLLFSAKYRRIIDYVTRDILLSTLRNVTISDPDDQTKFEQIVMKEI